MASITYGAASSPAADRRHGALPGGLQTKAAAVHSGSECLESLRAWDNPGGLYYACHCPLLMHLLLGARDGMERRELWI